MAATIQTQMLKTLDSLNSTNLSEATILSLTQQLLTQETQFELALGQP